MAIDRIILSKDIDVFLRYSLKEKEIKLPGSDHLFFFHKEIEDKIIELDIGVIIKYCDYICSPYLQFKTEEDVFLFKLVCSMEI